MNHQQWLEVLAAELDNMLWASDAPPRHAIGALVHAVAWQYLETQLSDDDIVSEIGCALRSALPTARAQARRLRISQLRAIGNDVA